MTLHYLILITTSRYWLGSTALARAHEAQGGSPEGRRHGEEADKIAGRIHRSLAGSGLAGIIPQPVASSH